jgi:hypothetical protein
MVTHYLESLCKQLSVSYHLSFKVYWMLNPRFVEHFTSTVSVLHEFLCDRTTKKYKYCRNYLHIPVFSIKDNFNPVIENPFGV